VDAAHDVLRELAAIGRQGWVERADFADPHDVADLAGRVRRRHPALDLLVNSAACYEHRPFEGVSRDVLRQMIAINLEAPFLLTQHLLPALRTARGAVVNITDMAVNHAYTPTHLFSHYVATKAALEQLTRSWALELGPEVRVNAVAPGPVAMASATTSAQRTEILARIPAGREGSPEDVADAAVFLALAPYVTGQTLRVDGGLSVT
jgi:pteridine reductase